MPKPNPDKFAKNVLWQLAGIRAAINQLQGPQVLHLVAISGQSVEKVQKQMLAEQKKIQRVIYDEMAKSSGLIE